MAEDGVFPQKSNVQTLFLFSSARFAGKAEQLWRIYHNSSRRRPLHRSVRSNPVPGTFYRLLSSALSLRFRVLRG